MTEKNTTAYSSPVNEKEPYCFPKKTLEKLLDLLCKINKEQLQKKERSEKQLYGLLNNKLKSYCGTNKHWLWCGCIERIAEKKGINNILVLKKQLRNIEKKNLRPEKPLVWYKNPNTWLSNYDIQNVMVQFKDNKKYKYEFLGVFPIDFSVKSSNGTCVYGSFCNININDYIKRGIKYIGFITNLDKHDEPGSHWTSNFLVIDPKSSSYGAYYYDSTVNNIPPILRNFYDDIQRQMNTIYPNKPFNIVSNKKRHQFKNSECGMFSMMFQIRWINKLVLKNNLTNFEEITANPFINDEKMLEIRNYLFRPNARHALKDVKF